MLQGGALQNCDIQSQAGASEASCSLLHQDSRPVSAGCFASHQCSTTTLQQGSCCQMWFGCFMGPTLDGFLGCIHSWVAYIPGFRSPFCWAIAASAALEAAWQYSSMSPPASTDLSCRLHGQFDRALAHISCCISVHEVASHRQVSKYSQTCLQ